MWWGGRTSNHTFRDERVTSLEVTGVFLRLFLSLAATVPITPTSELPDKTQIVHQGPRGPSYTPPAAKIPHLASSLNSVPKLTGSPPQHALHELPPWPEELSAVQGWTGTPSQVFLSVHMKPLHSQHCTHHPSAMKLTWVDIHPRKTVELYFKFKIQQSNDHCHHKYLWQSSSSSCSNKRLVLTVCLTLF